MHLVNVRARTIQYSTETKARERIEKEKRLQEQYTNAKSTFETNLNASLLNSAKYWNWNCFMEKSERNDYSSPSTLA